MKKIQLKKLSYIIPCESPAHQILMPLLYFEIFKHPLTVEEILNFSHNKSISTIEMTKHLEDLIQQGYIFQYEKFFLTQDCPEWVQLRKENNERAIAFIEKAKWMTQIIQKFPFVRGVFLSGSLSKNVIKKNGDIDYFIITQPNRLWIACTFLILFKKIFLLNSRKYFCVNYFIDENHLEIEEKNRFNATEVITLLPVYNHELYHRFQKANSWVNDYFPNHSKRLATHNVPRAGFAKRWLEKILNLSFFDQLDTFFMNRTIRFWKKKYALNSNKFDVALKSRPHVSKRHPDDFQERIKQAYENNIKKFEKRNGVLLERNNQWIIEK